MVEMATVEVAVGTVRDKAKVGEQVADELMEAIVAGKVMEVIERAANSADTSVE